MIKLIEESNELQTYQFKFYLVDQELYTKSELITKVLRFFDCYSPSSPTYRVDYEIYRVERPALAPWAYFYINVFTPRGIKFFESLFNAIPMPSLEVHE